MWDNVHINQGFPSVLPWTRIHISASDWYLPVKMSAETDHNTLVQSLREFLEMSLFRMIFELVQSSLYLPLIKGA